MAAFLHFCHDFFNVDPIHTSTGHIPMWIEGIRILVRTLMGLFAILLVVPGLVWYERRLLGWMQQRQGPNRVGPWGLLQTIADGVKLLFKEDMNPLKVDKVLFILAPILFLIPSLVIPGVLPWGPSKTWGAVSPDNLIGVLYLLAWSSLAVYGIVLAGWSSNNKYSLLGGLRSSAQIISYELAMGLAILSVVLLSGSLNLRDIVEKQAHWTYLGFGSWNILALFPLGLVGFILYTISMLAETNRAPFDLPEAETELVAGYHTEYTSMKFATFFMGEYANMIIVSAINATLFLGGYHAPIMYLDGAYLGNLLATSGHHLAGGVVAALVPIAWFWAKIWLGLYFFIWVRATMPRLRYDMLMRFGWMGLLPIGLVNLVLVAIGITYGWPVAAVAFLIIAAIAVPLAMSTKPMKKFANNTRRDRSVTMHGSAVPFRASPQAVGRGGQASPPSTEPVESGKDGEGALTP